MKSMRFTETSGGYEVRDGDVLLGTVKKATSTTHERAGRISVGKVKDETWSAKVVGTHRTVKGFESRQGAAEYLRAVQ